MNEPTSEIQELLDECVRETVWVTREQIVDSSALRSLYQQRRLGVHHQLLFMMFKPQAPEATIARLSDRLRVMFCRYVDAETDRIGNGWFSLTGGSLTMLAPTMPVFARSLLKPVAVLGASYVARLVAGWAEGGPLRLKEYALLDGAKIENDIELQEGISLATLPQSALELPTSIPISPVRSSGEYVGRTVICIECSVTPAIYKPGHDEADEDPELPNLNYVYGTGRVRELDHTSICEALSLACDHHISWRLKWFDRSELKLFSNFVHSAGTPGLQTDGWAPDITIEAGDLESALRIHVQRYAPNRSGRGLNVAIKRWLGSKRRQSIEDKFIDLRIAFESLYLKGGFGELSFRVSTYCAWHLGHDLGTRRDIFDTVRAMYRIASKAAHGHRVKDCEEHRDLLRAGQDVCRQAILLRIEKRIEPEWNNLILGQRV